MITKLAEFFNAVILFKILNRKKVTVHTRDIKIILSVIVNIKFIFSLCVHIYHFPGLL